MYNNPFSTHTPRTIGKRATVSTNEIKPSELVNTRVTPDRPVRIVCRNTTPIADLMHGRTATKVCAHGYERGFCPFFHCDGPALSNIRPDDFKIQTYEEAQIMKSRILALIEAANNVSEEG